MTACYVAKILIKNPIDTHEKTPMKIFTGQNRSEGLGEGEFGIDKCAISKLATRTRIGKELKSKANTLYKSLSTLDERIPR